MHLQITKHVPIMKIINIPLRCFINMEKIIGKIFYFVEHYLPKETVTGKSEFFFFYRYVMFA